MDAEADAGAGAAGRAGPGLRPGLCGAAAGEGSGTSVRALLGKSLAGRDNRVSGMSPGDAEGVVYIKRRCAEMTRVTHNSRSFPAPGDECARPFPLARCSGDPPRLSLRMVRSLESESESDSDESSDSDDEESSDELELADDSLGTWPSLWYERVKTVNDIIPQRKMQPLKRRSRKEDSRFFRAGCWRFLRHARGCV